MSINEVNALTRSRIEQQIAKLCKPPGSLGVIEQVAIQLCEIQRTLRPETRPRSVTIFAADHGVTREGVSAWSSSLTKSVVQMMQSARTASGAFADVLNCKYEVVDVGLKMPLNQYDYVVLNRSKRRGTGNIRIEPALTEDDFQHAWNVGKERATAQVDEGSQLLIGGEMGIGNTTAATCLIARLCNLPENEFVDSIVGMGAGSDESQLAQKCKVVRDSLKRVRSLGALTPRQVGCHLGGLEIIALAGYYATGARLGATLLLDGLIATSAALLAEAVQSGTAKQMIAGHRSPEPAHQIALNELGLEPIHDLQMRLGEATGALSAVPLLDLAVAAMNKMAFIDELQL